MNEYVIGDVEYLEKKKFVEYPFKPFTVKDLVIANGIVLKLSINGRQSGWYYQHFEDMGSHISISRDITIEVKGHEP